MVILSVSDKVYMVLGGEIRWEAEKIVGKGLLLKASTTPVPEGMIDLKLDDG